MRACAIVPLDARKTAMNINAIFRYLKQRIRITSKNNLHNNNLPEVKLFAVTSIQESIFFFCFKSFQTFPNSYQKSKSKEWNADPPGCYTWKGYEIAHESMNIRPANYLKILHQSLLIINLLASKITEHILNDAWMYQEQQDYQG